MTSAKGDSLPFLPPSSHVDDVAAFQALVVSLPKRLWPSESPSKLVKINDEFRDVSLPFGAHQSSLAYS